ncbi:MAG: Rv3235 family protein [Lawsonella sp.]|nr:hypothetical protein [Mycobacteriales bacterium]
MTTTNRFVSPGSYQAPSWSRDNADAPVESPQLRYRQPLLQRDYKDCRNFARKVIPQILETVDRKRPLPHLRSHCTPEIVEIVDRKATARAKALAQLAQRSKAASQAQPPLRLMRLHMRARTLSATETQEVVSAERNLPPGYQPAIRPGQHKSSCTEGVQVPNLLLEICGTFRESGRVRAFAAAAHRYNSQWRLTTFNFV